MQRILRTQSANGIFAAQRKLGAKGTNAFGMWGFGFEPELCADAWSATLDGISVDGTPRCGAGDRVVRGGASQRYPWQGSDEWHLLIEDIGYTQRDSFKKPRFTPPSAKREATGFEWPSSARWA